MVPGNVVYFYVWGFLKHVEVENMPKTAQRFLPSISRTIKSWPSRSYNKYPIKVYYETSLTLYLIDHNPHQSNHPETEQLPVWRLIQRRRTLCACTNLCRTEQFREPVILEQEEGKFYPWAINKKPVLKKKLVRQTLSVEGIMNKNKHQDNQNLFSHKCYLRICNNSNFDIITPIINVIYLRFSETRLWESMLWHFIQDKYIQQQIEDIRKFATSTISNINQTKVITIMYKQTETRITKTNCSEINQLLAKWNSLHYSKSKILTTPNQIKIQILSITVVQDPNFIQILWEGFYRRRRWGMKMRPRTGP